MSHVLNLKSVEHSAAGEAQCTPGSAFQHRARDGCELPTDGVPASWFPRHAMRPSAGQMALQRSDERQQVGEFGGHAAPVLRGLKGTDEFVDQRGAKDEAIPAGRISPLSR